MQWKANIRIALLGLFYTGLLSSLPLTAAAYQLAPATLRLQPTNHRITVGQQTTVTVVIEGASQLVGFQFSVRYDPDHLDLIQVTHTPFLDRSGQLALTLGPEIDREEGIVTMGAAGYDHAKGTSGNGELAQLIVEGRAAGSTSLSIEGVQLITVNGDLQPVNLVGSTIELVPTTPVPPPTSPTSTPIPSPGPGMGIITGRVLLELRDEHGGTTITLDRAVVATTEADGTFVTGPVPSGVYTLTAQAPGYLTARYQALTVREGITTTLPPITLTSGDLIADHRINLFDLVVVAANYGTAPPDDPRADVNGDRVVNIFDLVSVARSYGKEGPEPWPTGQ